MIVKLIPETQTEKDNFEEVTHRDVKEFFLFGTKKGFNFMKRQPEKLQQCAQKLAAVSLLDKIVAAVR